MQKSQQRPQFEFVAIMASLMSIVALAIDALLPAMSTIGIDINSLDPTENQKFITMIFLGLGVGQLVFGPLSDSFGRKPIVYIGFIVFCVASVICVLAPNLEWMILGRILQGIGLSAPRTISISMIRDSYKGDYMAKIMSFVTAFFILVPIVAPAMGKFFLDHYGWEAIFYMQLVATIIVGVWFWRRQPETLKPEYKIEFSSHVFVDGFKELLRHRETMAFTIVSGLITGAFMVYLSSAQEVFEVQFGLADNFPYVFAGLAISVGLSTLLNGTMVVKLGMRRLAMIALTLFCTVSMVYVGLFWNSQNPALWILITFLAMQFFTLGFLFGNLRAIAMEPIGHIAGIGAAITGFISTMIAIPIATYVGSYIQDTILPLFVGFLVCGSISLGIFMMMRRRSILAAA
ncbi:multidrug effflux MFS transporter [Arenibacter algicola]|jgi:DHA1 family bicyclomycin/chloramphenicol resistance-like MFS transporter|uniref:Bicyclomycin resistance protein n=1 Tax=Arenibacter algicola TaxID=616991 RepID=A0A221UXY4_9FLAO|nr:multidrug effflux MFS transporter [Arenibacter algicola]ASO06182.1 bicyclomycin resistance protein [Arenibacter algicola]MDX1759964.1 multidrug effflux MFS transporter [Arenibacter algicola]HCO83932.1 MFS transporter [Arenibacter sp.]|tara:strand:- start:3765 stop:4973 length:1209 start_codon:yes stop_codon:yes gene_type:complete